MAEGVKEKVAFLASHMRPSFFFSLGAKQTRSTGSYCPPLSPPPQQNKTKSISKNTTCTHSQLTLGGLQDNSDSALACLQADSLVVVGRGVNHSKNGMQGG